MRLSAAALFVTFGLFCIQTAQAQFEFFGQELSAREKMEFDQGTDALEDVLSGVETLLDLYMYEKISNGNCTSVVEIEAKAKQGDAKSQWLLSDLFHSGTCVNQDNEEAFNWVEKAANQDFTSAVHDIAIFHWNGWGTEKRVDLAYNWLEKLAALGDVRAYELLGKILYIGDGIPQDIDKALEWALKGAEAKDTNSMLMASVLLIQKEKDLNLAYYYSLLTSRHGSPEYASVALELLAALNDVVSQNEKEFAAAQAENWNPNTHDSENILRSLPKLELVEVLSLNQATATTMLQELDLDIDRAVFFQSIREDNLGVFALYIKAGAPIETRSPISQATPLYRAAENGSTAITQYLIEAGANIDSAANQQGDSPILVALANGHLEIANMLIAAGAQLKHSGILYNAVKFNSSELLETLYNNGARNINEMYVGTPLAQSTFEGCKPDSVKWLLAKGADPNKFDFKRPFDTSALLQAVSDPSALNCVELLLENGANPNDEKFGEIENPLFVSIVHGNNAYVQLLLKHDAKFETSYYLEETEQPMRISSPITKNVLSNGGSMLMIAVSENHMAVAKSLLDAGADPYSKLSTGETVIDIAERIDNPTMIKIVQNYHDKNKILHWFKTKF